MSKKILELCVLIVAAGLGCELTVTSDRPTYDELDLEEKNVVAIVLKELTRFNSNVATNTKSWKKPVTIDRILDKEKIHVSFHGLIFSANLGDEVIHVAAWDNLGSEKQALIQKWFNSKTEASAKTTYEKFFYQFMTVVQGAKQFMYEALTPQWVYSHRSLFNVERDSIRTALSHYVADGRKAEMWNFVGNACNPVISQFDKDFASKFSKTYLLENFPEIFDPKNPTGYMYFICRWIKMGQQDAESLNLELEWLRDLPQ